MLDDIVLVSDQGNQRITFQEMSQEKNAAWCTVELDMIFQAVVKHVGRGKFAILKDNQEGRFIGKIIDASEILACDSKRTEI
jgi:hypothetical protein